MSCLRKFTIFEVALMTCSFATTISVPGDYATIQEAINASIDGDSIAVAAGTYYEHINFYGKKIKLVGADQSTTFIDGSDTETSVSGLVNGGFESYYEVGNGWQMLPIGWETWDSNNGGPNECCYAISLNGENVYQSDSIFYTYEGAAALKMWGTGGEWNVFQTFYDFLPGTQIDVSAMVFQATDDHIGDGSTFHVFLKYFDSNWNYLGAELSQAFTSTDSMNIWLQRYVNGIVPDDGDNNPDVSTVVQAGLIYTGEGGAVNIDNFEMTVNTTRFASDKFDNPLINYDPSDYPDRSRQGGNTVDDAVVVPDIPYSNFGTTNGYTDDYDEVCPYSNIGSTYPAPYPWLICPELSP